MLTYFVIYKPDLNGVPVGIVVRGQGGEDALMWNHRAGAWTYDPSTAGRFLGNEENWDRFQPVDRDTAALATPQVTGGQELPDEESIRWIFQWKGEPPQTEQE
jgi:hypothetical protein